ncbi:MAG: putative HD phosphohydrolase [Gammaproteobacteria bacterium]|jgi:predicted HD phosphohydrolase
MEHVEFINMADGTAEEYAFLDKHEEAYVAGLSDRLLNALGALEHSMGGYKISRLGHSLQSATRAHRAGEAEEMVVAALLHDIGDELAPLAHSEMAAAILRPYVSEKTYWIVKHHGLFQMVHYAHHFGGDPNARERHKDHQWYQATVDFCENYDQNCFDPNYDTQPLSFFEPMVHRVFAQIRPDDEENASRRGAA